MLNDEVMTPAPDGGPFGAGVITSRRGERIRRALKRSGPVFAMAPFVFYTFLGLGVPSLGVVYFAFRGEHGGWTINNFDQVTHGVFLTGFENSIVLSLISSVLPAIFGVFLAYAIQTSHGTILRRLVITASGVLANFGGVNLTFMFIATLGSTGVLTIWLHAVGLNIYNLGFNLLTFSGVVFVYMYFQIPLMVLVITPALAGLRPSWREAAENLGASSWKYWRYVGVPVLLPSMLGGTLLLFGSAFAAYATAESLTLGLVPLSPIQIGDFLNGNAIAGEVNVGYAIALGMLVILAITMTLYSVLRKRASRWLQ
jgi:putative spermidine/putrescine transport system permease protein